MARMTPVERLSPEDLLTAKKLGFSDAQIGHCVGITEKVVSKMRWKLGKGREYLYRIIDHGKIFCRAGSLVTMI